MKNIFLVSVAIILLSFQLTAQTRPVSYKLGYKTAASGEDNPAGTSISNILVIGDTVWVASGAGLSRSTDRGASWTNFYGSETFGTQDIVAIAYGGGRVWVSTAFTQNINGSEIQTGGGLKFSSDNGNTWTSLQQPVDQPQDSVIMYGDNKIRALPVTVPQQNLSWDIAVVNDVVYIASWAGGVRRSRDLGKTWERVVLPPDNLDAIKPSDTLKFALQPVAGKFGPDENLNHMGFSLAVDDSNNIYAGTAGGINKSTDGGISWRKFRFGNQKNSISGNFVVAMGFNENDRSLWAATWLARGSEEFNAVSYSYDHGENWNIVLQDEKVHNFGFIGNSAIAASDNGPFKSTDGGRSWALPFNITDSKTMLPLNTNVFYSAASLDDILFMGSGNGLVSFIKQQEPWTGDWKIYFSSTKIASADDSFAYPNPFTPGVESVKIKYGTAGKHQKVTIRIFDFGMNLIKTVIQNADRGYPIHSTGKSENAAVDYWDGKDEFGSYVPNGVYFYRIDLDSGDPLYGKIIVLK